MNFWKPEKPFPAFSQNSAPSEKFTNSMAFNESIAICLPLSSSNLRVIVSIKVNMTRERSQLLKQPCMATMPKVSFLLDTESIEAAKQLCKIRKQPRLYDSMLQQDWAGWVSKQFMLLVEDHESIDSCTAMKMFILIINSSNLTYPS